MSFDGEVFFGTTLMDGRVPLRFTSVDSLSDLISLSLSFGGNQM